MTRWAVRLTEAAERDMAEILRWTADQFGAPQAETYGVTIIDALAALAAGPEATHAKSRHEILPGLFSLHVARGGRKGRHFIMFRADRVDGAIEVLRLLHDSMDLARHMPKPTGKS